MSAARVPVRLADLARHIEHGRDYRLRRADGSTLTVEGRAVWPSGEVLDFDAWPPPGFGRTIIEPRRGDRLLLLPDASAIGTAEAGSELGDPATEDGPW